MLTARVHIAPMGSSGNFLEAARFDSATLMTMAIAALVMTSAITLVARLPRSRIFDKLIWCCVFLLGAVGFSLMLVAPLESRSTIRELSNLIFLLGYGLAHGGARRLAHRPPLIGVVLAGPVLWAAAVWGFDISPAWRMPLASGSIAAYSFLAALEFRRGAAREEFARRAASWLCAGHGVVYLIRVLLGPNFGLAAGWSESVLSAWGAIISFEAILFASGLAMLIFAIMRETAEIEARHLAATDPLTGIGNRRAFDTMVPPLLARAAIRRPTLFLLDLDGFKTVNDRHGHEAGDHLLVSLARNVERELPDRTLFWRLGGDEFAILLKDADMEEVRLLAERVRGAVAGHDYGLGSSNVRVSATLGIAAHQPGMSIDELVRRADAALYRGKAEGRNCIFEHGMPRRFAAA